MRNFAQNFKQTGNFAQALSYFEQSKIIKDSLFTIEKEKAFNNLETKYILEKKQQEIKLLQNQNQLKIYENHQKNIILYTTLSGLTLLIAFTFFLYRANQQKQKTANELKEKNKDLFTYNQQLTNSNELIALMLQELNHRVLNNLQVVSMLINAQKRKTEDPSQQEVLEKIERRVKELANIHQLMMYRKNRQNEVDLNEYLTNITQVLLDLYEREHFILNLEIETNHIQLPLNQTYFLGFIVHEFFTNSLKYAYEEVEHPFFGIQVTKSKNKIYLTINDNGKGMPTELWEGERFKMELLQTLGIKIIDLIAQIHQGSLKIQKPKNQSGTFFETILNFK